MKYLRFVNVKPENLPDLGVIRNENLVTDMDGKERLCYIIQWGDKGMVRIAAFDKETGEYIGEQ